MADSLDFSHHVSQIPAGAALPESVQRHVKAEVVSVPDFQSAANSYASATNWMSSIGSAVATRASNAIATKMGYEAGKNPSGDVFALTDFDKTFKESYEAQAQSTLGLQAHKLISDANIEMAKSTRLSPGLIARTNQQVGIGLKNIFANAPLEVRKNLEFQYGQQQISLGEQATHRMIGEQRTDMRNNNTFASQTNAENAHALMMAGKPEAAQAAYEATVKSNNALAASHIITPESAKVSIDSARQAMLNGKYSKMAEVARAEGKEAEFFKNLADKRPDDLSDADYPVVANATMQHMQQLTNLRSQAEQLRAAKMNVSIAQDVMGITGEQLEEYRANVSPIQYERTQLAYIQAMKSASNEQANFNQLAGGWNDPAVFARAGEKAINHGFDILTTKYQSDMEAKGIPVTHEEAQIQVAASAGGKIPVFNEELKNKIHSGNPILMDQAATQIDALYSMNAEHALSGLNDQDKAIFSQFKSLRDSLPAPEAAKVAIENSNQDPDTKRMNQERWASFIKQETSGYFGKPPQEYALAEVGLNKDEFLNPGLAHEYGNLILNKYAAYYQMLNGDKNNALKLTKQHVEENYGYTSVNGTQHYTSHPLEKVLGYREGSDVVPFIQQDVMSNLNARFAPSKEAFANKQTNEYWDITPKEIKSQEEATTLAQTLFRSKPTPIQVQRYRRVGDEVKVDKYNVVVIGNAFNWDIAVDSGSGIRPLFQLAPYLGMISYTPNKKAIDAAYLKAHGHR